MAGTAGVLRGASRGRRGQAPALLAMSPAPGVGAARVLHGQRWGRTGPFTSLSLMLPGPDKGRQSDAFGALGIPWNPPCNEFLYLKK